MDTLFLQFGHDKKADLEIRLKKLFKEGNLCYSIDEANRVLNGHFTRSVSAGSNW